MKKLNYIFFLLRIFYFWSICSYSLAYSESDWNDLVCAMNKGNWDEASLLVEKLNRDDEHDLLFAGRFYADNSSPVFDLSKALAYLEKSANIGNDEAIGLLIVIYGLGVEYPLYIDQFRAAYWANITLEKYSGKSHSEWGTSALFNIGTVFQYGIGREKDIDLALSVFSVCTWLGGTDCSNSAVQIRDALGAEEDFLGDPEGLDKKLEKIFGPL